MQEGDVQAFVQMLIQFQPVLKKYRGLLYDEDAISQLQVFFVQLLVSFPMEKMRNLEDPVLIIYMNKSLYHEYIRISKQRQKEKCLAIPFSSLSQKERSQIKNTLFAIPSIKICLLDLTAKERYIIQKNFFENESISSIATRIGISRQAANQTKLRALKKLKT